MKALLWLLLVGCLLANVFVSLVVGDGVQRVLLSVVSGIGVIGAGTGLWLTRERRS
ncbi:hypothetical protein [Streptomyces sp. NPDC017529]|uniref:hypothetical protein n=1 Tax=Streptomyces sp. NPDC017529 TaxID=3365000 RepID=UPI00379EB43D